MHLIRSLWWIDQVMLDSCQVLVSITSLPPCPLTWNNMNAVAYKWLFFPAQIKQFCNTVSLFTQRISVGTQFLLPSFSITLFISRVQKRIQDPRNSHYSVWLRTLTDEKLLKSHLFMEKKSFQQSHRLKNSRYHGLLKRNYPKKVLLKTTACRGVWLINRQKKKKGIFRLNFSLSPQTWK